MTISHFGQFPFAALSLHPSRSPRPRATLPDCSSYLVHGSPPEVVEEDVDERGVRSQVPVVFDRTDVVEDEAAVAAVVVAHHGRYHHDGAQSVFEGHSRGTHRRLPARLCVCESMANHPT